MSALPKETPRSIRRRSTAVSTIVVMSASGLAALLGFCREVFNAHFFGTQSDVDAYLNASTIPMVLFGIFNGSLVSALVPVFSEYATRGEEEAFRRLAGTLVIVLFLIMLILTILAWFLAPLLVAIFAHGFPQSKQNLEVGMLRWTMPTIIANTLSGVFAAILNSRHRFMWPALVWVATNLVTIFFVVSFHTRLGIFSLVLGSLLGLFAQLLLQAPAIVRNHLLRFSLNLRHPGLSKVWQLFVPATLSSGAWQVNVGFDRYFASTLPGGSTASLNYTMKLAFLPIPIIAGAISTVIFPLIASQLAEDDRPGIRNSLNKSLQMVSFIVIPSAAGLSVLAYPIVQTLFERGAFNASSTALCATLLPAACISLVMISYQSIMSRACYACKEANVALQSSILVVIINVIASAILVNSLGAKGLLLANGFAMFCATLFLIGSIGRLAGGFPWKTFTVSLLKIGLASSIMSAILRWSTPMVYSPVSAPLQKVVSVAFLLVAGLACYLAAASLLKIGALDFGVQAVRKIFFQKKDPSAI